MTERNETTQVRTITTGTCLRALAAAGMIFAAPFTLVACEDEPFEDAADQMEDSAEEIGDRTEDAADDVQDAADDAADEFGGA